MAVAGDGPYASAAFVCDGYQVVGEHLVVFDPTAGKFNPPSTISVAYVMLLAGIEVDVEYEMLVEVRSPEGKRIFEKWETGKRMPDKQRMLAFTPVENLDVSLEGIYFFRLSCEGETLAETSFFVDRTTIA